LPWFKKDRNADLGTNMDMDKGQRQLFLTYCPTQTVLSSKLEGEVLWREMGFSGLEKLATNGKYVYAL